MLLHFTFHVFPRCPLSPISKGSEINDINELIGEIQITQLELSSFAKNKVCEKIIPNRIVKSENSEIFSGLGNTIM